METVTEFLLFLRPLLGCLYQGLNEERILGDSRGDGEDALRYPHLPQQRIVAALLDKLLEPPVRLQHVLVDGDGVRVLGTEGSVRRLPLSDVLLLTKLSHQNVCYGGDDGGGVLPFSQLTQELEV